MSLNLKYKGVFITATDTSVGKTTVAAGLVGFLKKQGVDVGVMKPVASGAIECDSGKLISQDAEMLVKFSGSTDPWEWINPYCLATSVTPSLAARIEGVAIHFDRIKSAYDEIARRHDFVVVEGAGGAMSPVFENLVVVDMIRALNLPALIVSRSALGTINHTRLTLEVAQGRGLAVAGVVVSHAGEPISSAEQRNLDHLRESLGPLWLGELPRLAEGEPAPEAAIDVGALIRVAGLDGAYSRAPAA